MVPFRPGAERQNLEKRRVGGVVWGGWVAQDSEFRGSQASPPGGGYGDKGVAKEFIPPV